MNTALCKESLAMIRAGQRVGISFLSLETNLLLFYHDLFPDGSGPNNISLLPSELDGAHCDGTTALTELPYTLPILARKQRS